MFVLVSQIIPMSGLVEIVGSVLRLKHLFSVCFNFSTHCSNKLEQHLPIGVSLDSG